VRDLDRRAERQPLVAQVAQQVGRLVEQARYDAGRVERPLREGSQRALLHVPGGAGNRVAVRVEARVAQILRDALRQPLGHGVLQPLGLVVDFVPAVAERLDQEQLDQPVMAHDFERDSLPGGGQADATIRLVRDELSARQLLRHFRCRGRGDRQRLGQLRGLHARVLLLKQVDCFEEVFDRFAVALTRDRLIGHAGS